MKREIPILRLKLINRESSSVVRHLAQYDIRKIRYNLHSGYDVVDVCKNQLYMGR